MQIAVVALACCCLLLGCGGGSPALGADSGSGGAPPTEISVGFAPAETTNLGLLEVGIGPYAAYPIPSVRLEVIAWLGGVIKVIGPDGKLVHPKLQFRAYNAPYTASEDPAAGSDHYVVVNPASGWSTLIVPVRSDIAYDNTGLYNRFVKGNIVGDYLVGKSGLGIRAVSTRCDSTGCGLAVQVSQALAPNQTVSGAIVPIDSSGQAIPWTGLTEESLGVGGAITSSKVTALRVDRGLVAADGSAWTYPPVGTTVQIDLKPFPGDANYKTWIADRRGIDAQVPQPTPAEIKPATPALPPGSNQDTAPTAPTGCGAAGGASGLAILALLALGLVGLRRRPLRHRGRALVVLGCLAAAAAPTASRACEPSATKERTVGFYPDAESTNVKLVEVALGPYQAYPDAALRKEYTTWVAQTLKMIGPDGKLTHPTLEFRGYDAAVTPTDDPLAGFDHYVVVTPTPGWYTLILPVRPDLQYDATGTENRFVNGNIVGDYLVGESGMGVRAVTTGCDASGCGLDVAMSQPLGRNPVLVGTIVPLDSAGAAISWTDLTAAGLDVGGWISSLEVASLRIGGGLTAADGSAWAYPSVGSTLQIDLKPYPGGSRFTAWMPDRRGLDAEIPWPTKSELQPTAAVPPLTNNGTCTPLSCATAGGPSGLALLAMLALGVAALRRRPR